MSARLKRLYAGTPATLGIVRGDKSLDLTVTPVEKLPPPQWASLGILPGEESAAGLAVRQVLAGGPAEKAELRLGDRLTHVDGQKVESLEQIVFALARKQPGDELKLRVSRDGKDFDRIAVMAPMDATIPAELAPRAPAPEAAPEGAAAAPKAAAEGKAEIGPAEGRIELPIVGRRQPCVAYVPKSGRSPRGVGLLVWLHGPGGVDVDATIDDWKPLCDAHGLALVLPSSDDPRRWSLDDVEDIAEAVRELAERTPIDPFRTAIAGYQTGGAQALRMGLGAGGRFRGVAAIDAPLAAEPPEFNPARPVVFYFATSPASRFARRIEQGIGQLREQGYPIVLRDLGPQPRELTPDERTELARWADSLDRI